MNKIDVHRRHKSTPYAVDYAQWCAEQGALLRKGRLEALDRQNLAEEIESLGQSEEGEIESRLIVLLTHLLKWAYQPERQTSSWRATMLEQRTRILKRLKASPSLRSYPVKVLDEEYEIARLHAAGQTGFAEEIFPEACPFTIEQILDTTFFPQDL